MKSKLVYSVMLAAGVVLSGLASNMAYGVTKTDNQVTKQSKDQAGCAKSGASNCESKIVAMNDNSSIMDTGTHSHMKMKGDTTKMHKGKNMHSSNYKKHDSKGMKNDKMKTPKDTSKIEHDKKW